MFKPEKNTEEKKSFMQRLEAERIMAAAEEEPENKRSFFGRKYHSVYGDQLVCLCALLIMAVWRWGLRALLLCALSVFVSVFTDYICCVMTKKTYNPKDLSTYVSGMALCLMMPATLPYRYIVFGAAFAMTVKHIFGGKNNYVFNPACLSFAFMAICWPSIVLMFPLIGDEIPLFDAYQGTLSSGLESYMVKLGTAQALSAEDILLGNFLGPMGTTHVLILMVCGVCLMFRRALSPTITLTTIASFVGISILFPVQDNVQLSIVIELICGNLLFGLLFLASDPQTMPRSALGKVYYGIIIGILMVIFRHLTNTETSFAFVLLIANAVSLHIDLFAEKTVESIKHLGKWVKTTSGSFERARSQAQKEAPAEEEKKALGDTQEIIVPLMNYNMPAVDNKIIKAAKKPPKIVKGEDDLPVIKEKKDNPVTSFIKNQKLKKQQEKTQSLVAKQVQQAVAEENKKALRPEDDMGEKKND